MFYQTYTARKPRNHPRQRRNGAVRCWCTLFAASAYHLYATGGDGSAKRIFCLWWPWLLTFDFDIETRPSHWPNTPSVWIWRKSVQPFPRYLIHKQKTYHTQIAKNRTLLACGKRFVNVTQTLLIFNSRTQRLIYLKATVQAMKQSTVITSYLECEL